MEPPSGVGVAESSASAAGNRSKGTTRRRVVTGIGPLVIVGLVGIGLALIKSRGAQRRVALPDHLRSRLIFLAAPGNAEIVRADGTVVSSPAESDHRFRGKVTTGSG